MGNTTWKNCERRVAERVGSKREGPKGESTYDVIASDEFTVDGRKLGIEVKYRRSVPQWLVDFLKQAVKHQKHAEEDLGILTDPIVVLAPAQASADNMTVMMRLGDYLTQRRLLVAFCERLKPAWYEKDTEKGASE